jgi:DNA repair protein RadC
MNADTQYDADVKRLSELIGKYTGIPKGRAERFIRENGASKLLAEANALCDTESQRTKLSALFEFKILYETVKGGEEQKYTLDGALSAKLYFINHYADKSDRERFTVAFLDAQNRIIKTVTMSEGTVNTVMVHPREIIKEALFRNATGIMLAHNHPGGGMSPTAPDREITANIINAAKTFGIQVVDHIIVADNAAISLMQEGLLNVVIPDTPSMAASGVGETAVKEETGESKTEKPGVMDKLAAAKSEAARIAAERKPQKRETEFKVTEAR